MKYKALTMKKKRLNNIPFHIICLLIIAFPAKPLLKAQNNPEFVTNLSAVSPHPNLMWKPERHFDAYQVEIARDAAYSVLIDSDKVDHLARYVPAIPLQPGEYFWRVMNNKELVHHGTITIEDPELKIHIPAGSGMAEIRSALEKARNNGSTHIYFDSAVYHLYPGEHAAVFDIQGIQNLIVDGKGASVVIHDIAPFARLKDSKHITIRNFSVDYEVPLYTAATVDKIGSDGTMELSLLPGCAKPETIPRFMEEKRGMFYEPEFPRIAEDIRLLVYMKDAWEPLGDGRYRLQALMASETRNVRPGMVYICAPRWGSQGIELLTSDDVTFADITTYYLPGIGVSTHFVNDLKLIRLKMLRRKDRLLGVQNGGTNIHNARIGPWIEGCRFENTGDDCNHISALLLTAVSQPAHDVVGVVAQQAGSRGLTIHDMDVMPGDTLAFFDRPSGSILAKVKVLRTEVDGAILYIKLEQDIPSLVLGTGRGTQELNVTQIYNLNRACGNFAFRNNSFVRGRRIGILAKSGPGLIENNTFLELGAGGIEIWNAPYEGLYAHDILIQNNLFIGGGLVYRRTGPPPAIWSQIFSGDSKQPLHRNLRITGNRIEDYLGNGIEIRDVVGAYIVGNHFVNTSRHSLRDVDSYHIKLVNVEGGVVKDNQYHDKRFPASQRLGKLNVKDVIVN